MSDLLQKKLFMQKVFSNERCASTRRGAFQARATGSLRSLHLSLTETELGLLGIEIGLSCPPGKFQRNGPDQCFLRRFEGPKRSVKFFQQSLKLQ